ncbi:MAG: type II/IV secretion system ATPase subunit [Candidatus Micrarchaeota archaeon]
MIKTLADEICGILEHSMNNSANAAQLAKQLDVDPHQIERVSKALQSRGIVGLTYPIDVTTKPWIKLLKPVAPKVFVSYKGKELSQYPLKAHLADAKVSILDVKKESRPIYDLDIPSIGPYTKCILAYVRDRLARNIPIKASELIDVRKSKAIRENFHKAAMIELKNMFPTLNEKISNTLAGVLIHEMYGLGIVEFLMADDNLEEIAINGASVPLSVYHKTLGWLKTNIWLGGEDEIYNYAAQIGRKAGRDITVLTPILDAYLDTGDRVNATLFPISTAGNTITIRRFARDPWTIIDFINPVNHTMSSEMAAFIWLCMQYEMNVLVVGGTASGKTSTLNTTCALIPPSNRIITIEDTRELSIPQYLKWNWVPLVTRNPNPEGYGEVNMLDLMVSSLRMRPDRMVVGEVRKKREAEVLFEAMHTGHAVYSTFHADTAPQVLRRLTNPPFDLPNTELQSLHLLVVQYRDRRRGIRRTYEITEVISSSVEMLSLNPIFRWRPRQDVFQKENDSMRIVEELNTHTGMSIDEINKDLKDKKFILEWLSKHKWRSVDQVGDIMALYYKEPDNVLKMAKSGKKPNL